MSGSGCAGARTGSSVFKPCLSVGVGKGGFSYASCPDVCASEHSSFPCAGNITSALVDSSGGWDPGIQGSSGNADGPIPDPSGGTLVSSGDGGDFFDSLGDALGSLSGNALDSSGGGGGALDSSGGGGEALDSSGGGGDALDSTGGVGGALDCSGGGGGALDSSGGGGGALESSGGDGGALDSSGGGGGALDSSGGGGGALDSSGGGAGPLDSSRGGRGSVQASSGGDGGGEGSRAGEDIKSKGRGGKDSLDKDSRSPPLCRAGRAGRGGKACPLTAESLSGSRP